MIVNPWCLNQKPVLKYMLWVTNCTYVLSQFMYNNKFDRMRFSMRNQCKKRKNRSPEVFPHEHYAVLVRVELESHTVVQTPPPAWCPPQSGYPHFLLPCCRYPHHVVALVMWRPPADRGRWAPWSAGSHPRCRRWRWATPPRGSSCTRGSSCIRSNKV